MPEVRIVIGGREFDVSCQPGEEGFLRLAADLLDAEAQTLLGQIGRIPEQRMLLMSGLLLADRTLGLEEQLTAALSRAEAAEAELQGLRDNPLTVEVPVIPEILGETMAEIAARTEALAARVAELTEFAEEAWDELHPAAEGENGLALDGSEDGPEGGYEDGHGDALPDEAEDAPRMMQGRAEAGPA